MTNFEIIDSIKQADSKLSKSQRKIAEYITGHYDTAAYMTASKIAETVGVSESTVVRFATELGYEGFPEFQKSLREFIRNKLTHVQRMEITSSRIGDEDTLKKVVQSDIEKLRQTLDTVSAAAFESAVDSLIKADTVYILGTGTCYSLASFMEVYLNTLLNNVKLVANNSSGDVFEHMHRIGANDVLVAISYPRYSQRTLSGVGFAANRGAEIIAITDSETSPIVKNSTNALIAGCDLSNFVDSLIAPLSLINALIVAIVMRDKSKASKTFETLEEIRENYQTYGKLLDN